MKPPFSFACTLLLVVSASLAAAPEEYFGIQVVDADTGRGVPLVELRTVHHVTYWTDSGGWVAFHEPGLMNEHVFFFVTGDGYHFPNESLGSRGFTVRTVPGGRHEVRVERRNVAERLYRLTGGGIYRDSILLGIEPPSRDPLLNARVLGQDSTMAVPFRGKTYWFWGDTLHPAHPLGNFDMTVATTPPGEELDPDVTIDYDYFQSESGFTKRKAPVPGDGPTWLSGFGVIEEEERELLVGGFAKIRNQLETYARGLVVYDEEEEIFHHHVTFPPGRPLHPIGHTLALRQDGTLYFHYQNPLPIVRAEARLETLSDPATYQAFTPLIKGTRREDRQVERNADGEVIYGWKRDTPEVGPREQDDLVKAGALAPEEQLFSMRDWRTGKEIALHAGSVNWNDHRQRWVLIVSEILGDSVLGEVWFAEADSPLGPWCYGQKIVSHANYTFYNVRHHPFLDREDGRLVYFEGTYTALFSGVEQPTPRYDYNQILYRLDLDNPRLDLPVAYYRTDAGCLQSARGEQAVSGRPVFWAWENAGDGRVGVVCRGKQGGRCELDLATEDADATFFVLSSETAAELPHALDLSELIAAKTNIIGAVLPHPTPRGPVLPPVPGPSVLP